MADPYTPDESLRRALGRRTPPYTPDPNLQQAMRPRPPMSTSRALVPAGPRTVNPDPLGRNPRMAPSYDASAGDRMAAERMRAQQAADRAASRARYAAPEAPANPKASPKGGLARRAASGIGRGVGRGVGAVARVATPAMIAAGAYKSGTMSAEDRRRFNNDMGVTDSKSVGGDLANNAANVAFNVGNTLSFGLGEKLGQGIGSWAGGGSFKEGWKGKTFDERGGPKPADTRAPGGGAWTPSYAPAGWAEQANKENAQMTRDTTAITSANALADQMQRRSAAGGLMVAPNNRYDPDAAVYASGAVKDGGYYDKASPGAVIGQFNGRDITKAESEVRGGSLVTSSGPVAMGGGGFAASTGRSMAQQAANAGRDVENGGASASGAGGTGGQAAMQRRSAGAQSGDSFGGYAGFRGGDNGDPQVRNVRGDLSGADRERRDAIGNLDLAIKNLTSENGGLNMRSKRDLYGQLLRQRSEMAGEPYGVQHARDIRGAELEGEMATRNADRGLKRDELGWDMQKFSQEMSLKRRGADSQADYLKMLQDDAKAKREDDKYGDGKREQRDKFDEGRVNDFAAALVDTGLDPITARAQAQQALFAETAQRGEAADTGPLSTGDLKMRGDLASTFDQGQGWGSQLLDGEAGVYDDLQYTDAREFNPNDIEIEDRMLGWLPFVDEKRAVGPVDPATGMRGRKTMSDTEALSLKRKLDLYRGR